MATTIDTNDDYDALLAQMDKEFEQLEESKKKAKKKNAKKSVAIGDDSGVGNSGGNGSGGGNGVNESTAIDKTSIDDKNDINQKKSAKKVIKKVLNSKDKQPSVAKKLNENEVNDKETLQEQIDELSLKQQQQQQQKQDLYEKEQELKVNNKKSKNDNKSKNKEDIKKNDLKEELNNESIQEKKEDEEKLKKSNSSKKTTKESGTHTGGGSSGTISSSSSNNNKSGNSKKGNVGALLKIKEALAAQQKIEDDLKKQEEEKLRKEEEARQAQMERERLEKEKKEKKKLKEKQRIERQKAEGTYKTKAEKEKINRALAQLAIQLPQQTHELLHTNSNYIDNNQASSQESTLQHVHQVTQQIIKQEKTKIKYDRLKKRQHQQQSKEQSNEKSNELYQSQDQNEEQEQIKVIKNEDTNDKLLTLSTTTTTNIIKDDWDASTDEENENEIEGDANAKSKQVKVNKSDKNETNKKCNVDTSESDNEISDKNNDNDSDENDDDDDDEVDDDVSDNDIDNDVSDDDVNLTPIDKAKKQLHKIHEQAERDKSVNNLRSPIICVLGHVDTGKTKILDNLRRTHVQEDEAGGITQQIGATNVPLNTLVERTKMCTPHLLNEIKIPGLLIIDTPGHESFKSLRNRGSSMCDIAILVIDIMHGLEPQTIESIQILKEKKCPFVVALNKIDRLFGWKSLPTQDVQHVLKQQTTNTQMEFEKRTNEIVLQLAEQGLNSSLYYTNPDTRTYISLVPTSAHSSDGMGNLIALLINFSQTILNKRIQYSSELQCSVLEVKVVPSLGTTIDVCLVNGKLRVCDTIVCAGQEGPIVTQIRGLLMPASNRDLRIKSSYQIHKEIKGAQGIKIAAKGLEKAMPGLPLFVAQNEHQIEYYKHELNILLKQVLGSIKLSDTGVFVQASTLGSLEALLEFLRTSKIPYAGINIGPVHKKDVTRASIMLEKDSQWACILAFDVKVEREAQELADRECVRIFTADIIYHLFDKFMCYRDELKRKKKDEFKDVAVFPCKLKILQECIFNTRDPIIIGIRVESGFIRLGTPICAITEFNAEQHTDPKDRFVDLGRITSIEYNHKAMEMAKIGNEVCIRIENTSGGAPKLLGRHFQATDTLASRITRDSIDAVKNYFREEMSKTDWELIIELKKLFGIL